MKTKTRPCSHAWADVHNYHGEPIGWFCSRCRGSESIDQRRKRETREAEACRRPDLVERRLRLMREIIPSTPLIDWLLLTKRPEHVRQLVPPLWMAGEWLRNVWIGASVSEHARIHARAPGARSKRTGKFVPGTRRA